MLIAVEGDVDMRMFFKGNEEHGYLYVGGEDIRPVQHVKDVRSVAIIVWQARLVGEMVV